MQIVSNGDSMHEMSNPVFWKKKIRKNIINVSTAEIAQSGKPMFWAEQSMFWAEFWKISVFYMIFFFSFLEV